MLNLFIGWKKGLFWINSYDETYVINVLRSNLILKKQIRISITIRISIRYMSWITLLIIIIK